MKNYWLYTKRQLLAGALLWLTVSPAAWGQARPRPFGAAQGLPQNGVWDLTLDAAGRLWGSTRSGAFRYDGLNFETFGLRQGLPATLILCLATAPDGTVWLGCEGSQLRYFRAGQGRVLRRFDGQLGGTQFLWADSRPGGGTDLWLVSARHEGDELLRLSLGPGPDTTLTRYNAAALGVPASAVLLGLGAGPAGQLWVSSTAGLRVLDRHTGQLLPEVGPPTPAGATVRKAWLVADTMAWLATSVGLIRASRAAPDQPWRSQLLGPAQGLPSQNPIYAVAHDPAGQDWADTKAGLYVRRSGQLWALADSAAGGGEDWALLRPDAEGNLWRRMANGLTQYLADEQFRRIELGQPLPLLDVKTLAPAPGGSWYVGGSTGLVRYWPAGPQGPRVESIASPPNRAGPVNAVLLDRRGGLWVASYKTGVARYEPATGRWWVPPWSSPQASHSQSGFVEDGRGRLWLRAAAGGATCYDPATDRVTTHSLQLQPTDARGANCFFRDRRGRLWVAGGSYGLFYLDEKTDQLRPAPGLSEGRAVSLRIQAIADDAAGNLWLGVVGDGLRRYDGRRLWPASAAASGPAPTSVLARPDGWLWLSTFRGLDLFDPVTDQRRHSGTAEGFTNNACAFNALQADAQGRLWVGTEDGLYVFDPAHSRAVHRPPALELTSLRVGRRDTALVPELTLPYDRNQLTFGFIGVSLSNPSQVRYRYRLVGLQAAWQPLTASTEATFTSLPAGPYRFELQAANAEGLWTPRPATYAFVIRPAWWNTAWFRALAALALVAAGYGLYRLRLGQVLAVERLRLGIARDLHDDVGSTLSSISILSQLAAGPAGRGSAGTGTGPAAPNGPLLMQIGESARQTLAAMDDIVWAINPAHDQPQDLSARLRSHAAELLEAQGLALHFATTPPPPGLKLRMQTRREVFLIYKELLNNSLKYAHARQVRVSLRFVSHHLELELADDGCGFDPAAPAQGGGHGLPNVQARAALLGGTLTLHTAPGQGTSWRLVVPT